MRALILSGFCLVLVAQVPAQDQAATSRMQKDLAALASPAMKGRGNGSPELEQATKLSVDKLQGLGLKVEIQRFPFVAKVSRESTEPATIYVGTGKAALEWGKQIEAYGFSADGDLMDKDIVFAGSGIQAQGYDNLAALDLKDHIAVITRKIPDVPALAHLSAQDRNLLVRISNVKRAGAVAVVVVDATLQPLQREEGPNRLDIPVLSATYTSLGIPTLEERVSTILATGQPDSGYLNARLTFKLKLKQEEVQLANVVAVIPGGDPQLKAEFIAIGAHMDHLGMGERHSLGGEAGKGQPHAGADDNASGVAMVLELAGELKAAKPKRSILVLLFSGEEEGLLGSQYWVQHPTTPLASVKFMVNFDMVGRLDPATPKLMLGGLGATATALEHAKGLGPKGLAISTDMGSSIGGSDHMSFATVKIPTFFFFTGLHSDYHRPSDTVEKLNVPGMTFITSYARTVVLDLADAPAAPVFDPETAKIKAQAGSPMKVSFGTIPDYAENPKGFRINGVSAGSTAESIGLQSGDILISFGGTPLKTIYDYMGALSAFKPGDTVEVVWLRGDTTMKAKATLKARN